jgi:hypothetical protein
VERQIVGTDIQGKVFGNRFFATGAKNRRPVYLGTMCIGERALVMPRSGVGQGAYRGRYRRRLLGLDHCRVRKGAQPSSIIGDIARQEGVT